MENNDIYWKKLVSTGLQILQEQNNLEAVSVIKKSNFTIEYNSHDNWDGGIDYWDVIFQLKAKDYSTLENKNKVEGDILNLLESIQTDGRNQIANVKIQPALEQYIDWKAVLPVTKELTIRLIQEEQNMLSDVATGKLSFKEDGVEEKFQERHQKIITIAKRAGFDYPVGANNLAEWWREVRNISSYDGRREYILRIFSPMIKLLRESDDSNDNFNFQQIATKSGTVKKAVEDAEAFIREGKYDSAVDRVHTAFHGYLRQLLTEHCISFDADEGVPGLYSKLHGCYAEIIKPKDVGDRIKTILRSAGGMVNAVNELRNNNTVAHPNGQLIQIREAELVIRMVNAIVLYIEDVESTLKGE